jgi:hypothetical protein
MVLGSDELAREIAQTREEMGERLIELRRRGQVAARRTVRFALIAGALGGAAVVGLIAYRMSRPPTMSERVARVVPAWPWARRAAALRLPAFRLYVNDRGVREHEESTAQRLVVTAARAFGTAAATAAIGILVRRVAGRDQPKA